MAEDELHHHQDEPDSNAVKAVLESEQKKQDEMFEELFRVGKQLKRGALNFDQALEEDKKVAREKNEGERERKRDSN